MHYSLKICWCNNNLFMTKLAYTVFIKRILINLLHISKFRIVDMAIVGYIDIFLKIQTTYLILSLYFTTKCQIQSLPTNVQTQICLYKDFLILTRRVSDRLDYVIISMKLSTLHNQSCHLCVIVIILITC